MRPSYNSSKKSPVEFMYEASCYQDGRVRAEIRIELVQVEGPLMSKERLVSVIPRLFKVFPQPCLEVAARVDRHSGRKGCFKQELPLIRVHMVANIPAVMYLYRLLGSTSADLQDNEPRMILCHAELQS